MDAVTTICPLCHEDIEAMMGSLDNRERFVLCKRFGIDGDKMTLVDIGKILGLTRESVRRIEQQGIDNLRRMVSSNNYQEAK